MHEKSEGQASPSKNDPNLVKGEVGAFNITHNQKITLIHRPRARTIRLQRIPLPHQTHPLPATLLTKAAWVLQFTFRGHTSFCSPASSHHTSLPTVISLVERVRKLMHDHGTFI